VKLTTCRVREKIKHLKPCIHGGEIWQVASTAGRKREEILDFSSSVNPLGPSPRALESIKSNLEQISIYPDSNSTELRKVIAAHFRGISENNVIVGNGSTELIYLFAEAFMERDDVVLLPEPTFGEYERAVQKAGGEPKSVRLNADFHVDVNVLLREIVGAKVVFFCNPNNPTSVLTPPKTLTLIIEKALEEGALVVLDEDFLEFVDGEKHFSMIDKIARYPNLLVLRSFTKIFGLTGLRIGYGIASEEIINALLNAKTPWNVNCLAQAAAAAALNDAEHLRRTCEIIKVEKAFLLNALQQIKDFTVYPADANFVLIDVRKSGFTAGQFKARMLDYGVLIRDCSSFRGLDEYYIRIAVKTHAENERLLEAFRRTMNYV